MRATFGNYQFGEIEGYRISVGFTPAAGFGGEFYIYLFDEAVAPAKLAGVLDLKDEGPSPQGKLVITGQQRSYAFDTVELVQCVKGFTRRGPYRLAEFKIPIEVMREAGKTPVKLQNENQGALHANALGDAFQVKVGAEWEQGYGFMTRLGLQRDNIARFITMRNSRTSFLEKLVQLNDERIREDAMSAWKVGFTPHAYEITSENLVHAYVEESFGEAVRWPTPALESYLHPVAGVGDADPELGLARMKLPCLSAADLLMIEHRGAKHGNGPFTDTVETATLHFKSQSHRNPPIEGSASA